MRQTIKSLLGVAIVGATFFLQSCNSDISKDLKPNTTEKQSRTAAIIYSENFESIPIAWKVYTTTWSQGYATSFAGSKRLDQANLYAVYNRTVYKPVIYSTNAPIPLTAGTYTIKYSTITTSTTAGTASIDFVLQDYISGTETIISSVPLSNSGSPLTNRTTNFNVANPSQYYLKVVSSGNITPTPTKAGHCYIDDLTIQ